jgi:hypothetical protein
MPHLPFVQLILAAKADRLKPGGLNLEMDNYPDDNGQCRLLMDDKYPCLLGFTKGIGQ